MAWTARCHSLGRVTDCVASTPSCFNAVFRSPFTSDFGASHANIPYIPCGLHTIGPSSRRASSIWPYKLPTGWLLPVGAQVCSHRFVGGAGGAGNSSLLLLWRCVCRFIRWRLAQYCGDSAKHRRPGSHRWGFGFGSAGMQIGSSRSGPLS